MGHKSSRVIIVVRYVFMYSLNVKVKCQHLSLSTDIIQFQVWRYLTYSLVHGSKSHVIINATFELVVGLPLEMTNGLWRVALVYFSGVLAGSLASSSFEPKVYLAGASGGVYALIAAHLASLVLNWEEDSLILRRRIR